MSVMLCRSTPGQGQVASVSVMLCRSTRTGTGGQCVSNVVS